MLVEASGSTTRFIDSSVVDHERFVAPVWNESRGDLLGFYNMGHLDGGQLGQGLRKVCGMM